MQHHLGAHFTRTDPWRALAWVGVLLIAVLLVVAWITERPALILAMAIFLAAGLVLQLFITQLPSFFSFLLVVAALLSAAGGVFYWFETIEVYDEAVHTYTGFAGMASIGYLYARHRNVARTSLVTWCVAVSLLLGIGWEVIEELVGDLEFVDTATDLMFNTIGAALGGWFAWHVLQRGRTGQGRR